MVEIARRLVPEAEEGTGYGMPAMRHRGKPLLAVVAAAKHLSVFPFSGTIVEALADRLRGWSLAKGTIRFQPDQPLTEDVIEDLVRTRVAEIERAAR